MSVLGVVRRRWYVIVAGLLLTVVAAAGALKVIPATYQAKGSVLLYKQSTVSGADTPSNPFLTFDNGLAATGEVVGDVIMDKPTQEKLAAQGAGEAYTVTFGTGEAPLLNVEVDSPDAEKATATLDAVITEISTQLRSLQLTLGAPKDALIETRLISKDAQAQRVRGNQLRAAAGAVGAGLLLTLGVAFLVDALVRRRTARRRHLDPGGAAATASAGPDHPTVSDTRGESRPRADGGLATSPGRTAGTTVQQR